MRILNIGFDKTLVGGEGIGDAVSRHREYGSRVESLDIIVYTAAAEKLSEYKIAENVTGYPTNSANKLTFVFDALRCAKRIHDNRPFDVVVAQEPFSSAFVGFMLKRKYGCKLQINFHGDFWDSAYWLKASLKNQFLVPFSKYLIRQADGVRVVSEGIRQKLLRSGVPKDKIALLPTPVNFQDFSSPDPALIAKVRSEWKGKRVILFVGRLSPEKNLEWLLEIFLQVHATVPEAYLVFIGDGERKQDLVALAASSGLGDATGFFGSMHPAELAAYMSASDIVVLPSLTESLGKVLIEAAVAKKPVVSTRTTGAEYIVEDGKTGYLVDIGDTEGFAQKILELIYKPDHARELGEYASAYVRDKFDREKIVQGIVDFWKRILQKV